MQLDEHIAQVAGQLSAAAALGDERTKEIAAALSTAAGPAVRLAIAQAVGQAAAEITAQLLDYPGSPAVAVQLDAEELTLRVAPTDASTDDSHRDDGEPTARISLRLSDALKAEIDAAAEGEGVSVNTWLVRAASGALRAPFGAGFTPPSRGRGRDSARLSGWING